MSTPDHPPQGQPAPGAHPQQAHQHLPETQTPQYAAPQYLAPQYLAPQYAPPHTGRINVFGVIALALLLLNALQGLVVPAIFRGIASSGNFSLASTMITATHLVIVFMAAGFAIVGVVKKDAPRLRWTATGALVAAAIAIFASLANLVGGLIASVIPY